jgi:ribose transport system substrate-binding protein
VPHFRRRDRLHPRPVVAALVALLAIVVIGCGSDDDSDGDTGGSSGGTGVADSGFVAEAKAANERNVGPYTEWEGPTSSPTPQPGKKITCIEYLSTDVTARTWCDAVTDAGEAAGFEVQTLGGEGTAEAQRSAVQNAIATKSDAIVLASVDAEAVADPLADAEKANIPVIGIHSAPEPGPSKPLKLYTNLQSPAEYPPEAAINYIVAKTNGEGAQVLHLGDSRYAISRVQTDAFKSYIEKCTSCEFLEYINSPVDEASTRMPQLMSALLQRYQDPFWIVTVTDVFLDAGVPALRQSATPPEGRIGLIGKDGNPAAWERIRAGEYEQAVFVEPLRQMGYMAVDDANRAMNGEPPADAPVPGHLITKENIDRDLVDDTYWDPQNDYEKRYEELWTGS